MNTSSQKFYVVTLVALTIILNALTACEPHVRRWHPLTVLLHGFGPAETAYFDGRWPQWRFISEVSPPQCTP